MRPDQANTEPWTDAWASLDNNMVQQVFVPSLPRLSGVEVQLVTATQGVQDEGVSMSVADADGATLAFESKNVPVSECDAAKFIEVVIGLAGDLGPSCFRNGLLVETR